MKKVVIFLICPLLFCCGTAGAESLASLAKKEKVRRATLTEQKGPSLHADNKTLESLDKRKTPLTIIDKPDYVDRFERKLIEDARKEAVKEERFKKRIVQARNKLFSARKKLEELKKNTAVIHNKYKKVPEEYSELSRKEALEKYNSELAESESLVRKAEESLQLLLKEAKEQNIPPGVIREAEQLSPDSQN